MTGRRYAVVSPVRDEAAYLRETIDALVGQTVRPASWIIVDDGSTDDTHTIAREAAESHAWIQVHRRADRGVRKVGGGVIEAFNDGLALIDLDAYDYICKLDGDLRVGPTYFERLIEKFEADPRLGTASGKCWDKRGDGWVPLRTSDEFSLGAAKFYRVACFRDIGGFVAATMWDGIDCHRCRMRGWTACSLHDEELNIYEMRPMGSSHKSVLHGRVRWGRGQYFMGTHPLYALGITAYRLFEPPLILGGLCIGAGYVWGFLRRDKRYDDIEFRRHLHRWQLARLRRGG
jgi:glycosyltransferase involved in cell wall biosynthesis